MCDIYLAETDIEWKDIEFNQATIYFGKDKTSLKSAYNTPYSKFEHK